MSTGKIHEWVEEFPGAITVCDSAGVILELNRRAVESFRAEGGRKLIGSNLMDCHPELARSKLKRLMKRRRTNVYTVPNGRKRTLILQAPWYHRRKYRGFVQLSLPISDNASNRIPRH